MSKSFRSSFVYDHHSTKLFGAGGFDEQADSGGGSGGGEEDGKKTGSAFFSRMSPWGADSPIGRAGSWRR